MSACCFRLDQFTCLHTSSPTLGNPGFCLVEFVLFVVLAMIAGGKAAWLPGTSRHRCQAADYSMPQRIQRYSVHMLRC